MKRFLDWLASGGAEFSRLRVTTTARGGRGVVATAAFAPGDVLLRVPEPLLLTVDKAMRRPDVAEALQRARSSGVNTNDGNLALALYLAGEEDCFWSPYRQALGGVDHLPLFWPASDLELLAGSPLAADVAAIVPRLSGKVSKDENTSNTSDAKLGAALRDAAGLKLVLTGADRVLFEMPAFEANEE